MQELYTEVSQKVSFVSSLMIIESAGNTLGFRCVAISTSGQFWKEYPESVGAKLEAAQPCE